MKKLVCALAMCFALISGVFADEAKKSSGFDYHNIKIEAGVPLFMFGIGFDLRGSYKFPINENWWWNAGVDTSFNAFITGGNISLLGFGSIGWKTIYLSYGLGLGINTKAGEAGFVPLDLRFGWQPGFKNRDSGFSFKLEAGLFGQYAAGKLEFSNQGSEAKDCKFMACPGVNLGAAYKF